MLRFLLPILTLALLVAAEEVEVFREDFNAFADGARPSSMVEVRRAPRAYAEVLDGAYRIHHQLNAHCPVTPPLRDFTLTFRARTPWAAPVAVLFVDFRLDVARERGLRLYYRWGEPEYFARRLTGKRWEPFLPYVSKTTRLALLDYGERQYLEPILTRPFAEFGSPSGANPVLLDAAPETLRDLAVTDRWQDFRLDVRGERLTFSHNGVVQATLKLPAGDYPEAGAIGFDSLGFRMPGTLAIDDIRISSPDPLPAPTPVLARRLSLADDLDCAIVIDRLPRTWLRQIWRTPEAGAMYRLRATFHCPEVGADGPDLAVENPWFGLLSPGGEPILRQTIFHGILGRMVPGPAAGAAHRLRLRHLAADSVAARHAAGADADGPRTVTVYLPDLPETFHLAAGAAFVQRAATGGPIETIIDNAGKPVRRPLPQ